MTETQQEVVINEASNDKNTLHLTPNVAIKATVDIVTKVNAKAAAAEEVKVNTRHNAFMCVAME